MYSGLGISCSSTEGHMLVSVAAALMVMCILAANTDIGTSKTSNTKSDFDGSDIIFFMLTSVVVILVLVAS